MVSKLLSKFIKTIPVPLFLIGLILCGLTVSIIGSSRTFADQIQDRSIRLGSNLPSQVTDHSFQFVEPTTDTMGSIVFEYCTNTPALAAPCIAPVGLDASAATLTTQLGNTGFSIDGSATTANKIQLTRPPLFGSINSTVFDFSNITNPSTAGETTYVRILIYPTNNAAGNYNNAGAVAFVTSDQFNVSASVPPFLQLCVGISVAVDCSTTTDDSLDLGILSANHANTGVSQFSTGTNSPSGYAIFAQGTTMTSGNNAIPALATPTASFAGANQFGFNLRANSSPVGGEEPGGNGSGQPATDYGTPDLFTFNDGDMIAESDLPTDYTRMTVSYLVNVSNSQAPGIYSTTLTYTAVAQF